MRTYAVIAVSLVAGFIVGVVSMAMVSGYRPDRLDSIRQPGPSAREIFDRVEAEVDKYATP